MILSLVLLISMICNRSELSEGLGFKRFINSIIKLIFFFISCYHLYPFLLFNFCDDNGDVLDCDHSFLNGLIRVDITNDKQRRLVLVERGEK